MGKVGKSGKKWEKVAKSWAKVGGPKITFDRISRHFKSIRNFFFFTQNGGRRPFWMTENHFRMHFSPFQINAQLFIFFEFFFKMAAGRHFGSPFWSILDDRKSLSIAFLAISDQYITFNCFQFFFKMSHLRQKQ